MYGLFHVREKWVLLSFVSETWLFQKSGFEKTALPLVEEPSAKLLFLSFGLFQEKNRHFAPLFYKAFFFRYQSVVIS